MSHTAIVTGGTRGIGAAISISLSEAKSLMGIQTAG